MGEEVPIPLYATQKVADNVSEMEHNQPLSFGITLSKAVSYTHLDVYKRQVEDRLLRGKATGLRAGVKARAVGSIE